MAAAFERILQISHSGSIIVLAVLALRLILRNAPKRAVCLLWMLAVLRLLVPFEIESDWSLQPEPMEFAPLAQVEYFDSGTAPATVPPEFQKDAVEYPLQQPPVPEQKAEPIDLLPWVWLVGVAVLAAHGIVSFWRLKRRVRDSIILDEGVWVCPGLDTAFVLGFFRPRGYLPVLEAGERELVLLHERQHIRRGDHWWKLAGYAAVSIHWFNPLAWVTYVLMCRDMELACDQETVKGMDNARRKAYSAALLRCAARRSGIAACPVAFGEISVKERIKMVLNYKKPGFWVTVIALIAAVAVGVCLLTTPRTDLERCERALKQWQEKECIHLHISTVNDGDYALNAWSEADYWASGANAMVREMIDSDGNQAHWKILWDGIPYSKFSWEVEGEPTESPWEKDTNSVPWHMPWILSMDWDVWEITHLRTEQTEKGMDVFLEAYRPGDDVYPMVFSFEGQELKRIRRTFSDVLVEEREKDGILASYSTQTFTLEKSDRADIEKQIEDVGGFVPELVWLYRELEELQVKECVHLAMKCEKDNAYGGWESQNQEFLKWTHNWYWSFDMLSQYGEICEKRLWYGGAMYGRTKSNVDGVQQHPWQETEGYYDVPGLLTRDWRTFEVLDIRQEDGGAVITIQGDQSFNESVTFYSLICEFYLDRDGKLTKMVSTYHIGEHIDGVGDVETRGTNTTTILDTSNEEILERIAGIWREVKDEIRTIDIPEELGQLYRELEGLQNSESVHLLIDMEIDSDYPGWKTCRQEFMRSGDRFYRNFDYQSAAGPYSTTYLQYGNAIYAREYSEAGVVPNREWERIQDRGFGELPLLNQDWTRFAVLDIEQLTDGSAIITMQGNLDSTGDTTYYEKTYEFHLDPRGILTKQIGTYHASKIISDGFAQGTFEVRGTDTVHILETAQEELTKRILEEVMDLLDYKGNTQKNGD